MVSLKLSIAQNELTLRMRERLRANAVTTAKSVIWQAQDGQRLLIDLTTLNLKALDGWLVCHLDVQTDQTGRAGLQVVFFMGRPKEAAGIQAAATVNAATPAATQIAAVWADDIQRVLWDVVLDVLEACVWKAGEDNPNHKLTMKGFHSTPGSLLVEVLAEPIVIRTPGTITPLPTGARK